MTTSRKDLVELIQLLRDMAEHLHDDHTVASSAADAIVELLREVEGQERTIRLLWRFLGPPGPGPEGYRGSEGPDEQDQGCHDSVG